ncbi:MAG: transaldolase [Candidatus Omnitrophica bacterium]|nr:transaldolase [Candidatus Omnitrophota bacterium]
MQQLKISPIKEVLKHGQSIWYDGLATDAEFLSLIREDGVKGATTNPTIFEKALGGGDSGAQMRQLCAAHREEEVFKILAVEAVQKIADLFLPVYEESQGGDGFVSIEVSPLLAHDTAGTIEEARQLHRRVARKNVMIKVPATREGIPAIQTLIADGTSVNVTLIFSVERYEAVMNAYLAGLEERAQNGGSIMPIASVASFFVSRVDTSVDKRLEDKIAAASDPALKKRLESLLGKAAIANSKMAYAHFQKIFTADRFQKLKLKGARVQRPLWASTGTKNPRYSDVLYVDSLIGPDTVNTVPPATLAAFRDHGTVAPLLSTGISHAHAALAELESLGISLEAVTEELESAGVKLFAESYRKIIEQISKMK